MDILLNGTPINLTDLSPDTTLEKALQALQSEYCDDDTVIVSFSCDGAEVAADAMTATLNKTVDSFGRLDVVTGTKVSLVADAMEQSAQCIDESDVARERIAELLTAGNTTDAAQSLGECFAVWQQIHQAVAKSVQMLDIDVDRVEVDGEPLTALISRPKETLLQIKGALESHDYVLLADILQYEFGEVIESWHRLVGWLKEEAASRADEPQVQQTPSDPPT